jgi:hypothetical protein
MKYLFNMIVQIFLMRERKMVKEQENGKTVA